MGAGIQNPSQLTEHCLLSLCHQLLELDTETGNVPLEVTGVCGSAPQRSKGTSVGCLRVEATKSTLGHGT